MKRQKTSESANLTMRTAEDKWHLYQAFRAESYVGLPVTLTNGVIDNALKGFGQWQRHRWGQLRNKSSYFYYSCEFEAKGWWAWDVSSMG